MDQHWTEVLKLAEEYGFIVGASGGVAVLATHEVQKEQYGEDGYRRIQKMNGRTVTEP
jgi:cysteine synthase